MHLRICSTLRIIRTFTQNVKGLHKLFTRKKYTKKAAAEQAAAQQNTLKTGTAQVRKRHGHAEPLLCIR